MPPPPIPDQLVMPAPASSQAVSLPYSREEQKRAAAHERQAHRRSDPAVLAAEAAARAASRLNTSVRPERARDAAAHSTARQDPTVRDPTPKVSPSAPATLCGWQRCARTPPYVKEQAHLKSNDDDALVDQAALALSLELEAPK